MVVIMKTEKNILIAFLLNITFSIIELIGGFWTNSVAILSDSLHDFGDATSIGLSYFLERKSKKEPDSKYTFGYLRFSVLGGVINTIILTVGSVFVIYESILRIFNPTTTNYDGMIVLALFGIVINGIANYITSRSNSINEHSVSLHMLEDVLGWVVVLIGSIIMHFTGYSVIDPIMSILVSLIVLYNAIKNLKRILDIFLAKTPNNIDIDHIKQHLKEIEGVLDIHHVHVWTMDGNYNYATMHILTNSKKEKELKKLIREELKEHNIDHAILEFEYELCDDIDCHVEEKEVKHHHHH